MDTQSFENLNPEEQARIFRQSSFKERAELIRHSHDPLALTRALSHEELYLLTREMDIEDRAEVIKYATMPQLLFIGDVDCWKKDRLDGESFVTWLETLMEADQRVLMNWMLSVDHETLVTGFQKLIGVLKPDREYAIDELLGDTPYFTLDEMYFITVREENMETVRRVLHAIYENNRGRYVSLLESLMAEISDEIEEEAYVQRDRRLSERGFPDYESARKIYSPITREEFEAFPPKNLKADKERQSAPPNYPVLWSEDRLFLDEVLFLIPKDRHEFLEGLHEELAWVSNKVLASDGIDFSSEDKVRRGIERARGFISLGLQSLSGGDTIKALDILEKRWCETIFRWGVTEMLALKERAQAIVRDYWKGGQLACLEFLMPPYEFVFLGLLRPVPQCFDGEVREDMEPLRDFRRLDDLTRAKRSLDQIEQMFVMIERQFPGTLKAYAALEEAGNRMSALTVLGTLFAQAVLKPDAAFKPLTSAEVLKFADKAFEFRGAKRFLRAGVREEVLSRFSPESEKETLRVFWGFVLDHMEEEFGSLDLKNGIEPDFISSVRIKPPAKKSELRPEKSKNKKSRAGRK